VRPPSGELDGRGPIGKQVRVSSSDDIRAGADGASSPKPGELRMTAYGSDVTRASMEQAGEAMCDLLGEVGRALGHPGLKWRIGEIDLKCDGCGLTQSIDAPRGGWTNADSEDYCPSCSGGGLRRHG
jgi:hypothetical protein